MNTYKKNANIILLSIIFLISCGKHEIEPSQPAPLPPKSVYVDEDPLPQAAKDELDEITKKKIKEIQESGRHDFKLAIGCPNDKAHRERFGDKIKDWVFLDDQGFGKGNPFLHMNFDNLDTLKIIAGDGEYSLKGRFIEIAFDVSVARFGENLGAEHIELLLDLLAPGGKLYMLPDEMPFRPAAIGGHGRDKQRWLNILNLRISMSDALLTNIKKGPSGKEIEFASQVLRQYADQYPQEIRADKLAQDPEIKAALDKYEKNKFEIYEIAFDKMGVEIKKRHGDYPIPGDLERLKNLRYYELNKK